MGVSSEFSETTANGGVNDKKLLSSKRPKLFIKENIITSHIILHLFVLFYDSLIHFSVETFFAPLFFRHFLLENKK